MLTTETRYVKKTRHERVICSYIFVDPSIQSVSAAGVTGAGRFALTTSIIYYNRAQYEKPSMADNNTHWVDVKKRRSNFKTVPE